MEFWLEKSNAKQTRKFWLFCFMASYNNTKNENKQTKNDQSIPHYLSDKIFATKREKKMNSDVVV